MPDLGAHFAAGGMNLIHNLLPATKRWFSVKNRDGGLVAGRRTVDDGSFRHDESGASFGSATVIGGDLRSRHAIWRKRARHRRHDDAALEGQRPKREWLKQRVNG
jgi:hypothetical protein